MYKVYYSGSILQTKIYRNMNLKCNSSPRNYTIRETFQNAISFNECKWNAEQNPLVVFPLCIPESVFIFIFSFYVLYTTASNVNQITQNKHVFIFNCVLDLYLRIFIKVGLNNIHWSLNNLNIEQFVWKLSHQDSFFLNNG